jgi:hypothetical protein
MPMLDGSWPERLPLPNGTFAAYGTLGSGRDSASPAEPHAPGDCPCGSGKDTGYLQATQYLYDAHGVLLRTAKTCLVPDLDAIMRYPMDKQYEIRNRLDGYAYFTAKGSDQPVAVFDYDGRFIGKSLPAYRDGHYFQPIAPYYLAAISEAQKQAGVK